MKASDDTLIEVRNLEKSFPLRKGLLQRVVDQVRAVDNVSFHIGHGETLGLVGESGCGKTTTGRSILRLIEPSGGDIVFRSRRLALDDEPYRKIDVRAAAPEQLRALRREMQIIFQDPFSSLNPRMDIGDIVAEPLKVQGVSNGSERRDQVAALLDAVGLTRDQMKRYPHEFSGGQRQRIGIARALALEPQLIVADEPVSALDASVQAQVLNLLMDLQEERGLSYLFIAHDLSVVRHISDRVAVMYLGRLVEMTGTDELFANPLHPYTEALMSAVPVPDPDRQTERIILKGDVPSPIDPPSGCHFHPRCRYAEDICRTETPPHNDAGGGHYVACHLSDSLSLRPLETD
jgi:oligopeptide/dipeptide ABC transporter ATP-binding protein